jgi:monoamine oxidase
MGASEQTDTLVIGAGAAGLAAASELAGNGRDVVIVEARERIGGRVFTDGALGPLPIELGAEFIHGVSAPVLDRLPAASDLPIDASRERWIVRGSRLRRADADLAAMKRVFRRLAPPDRDMSFAEYLHRHRRSVPPSVRRLAVLFVEGFDAADVMRISTREVLDEWSGPAAADGPTFRPARGYGHLMLSIRQALPAQRTALHLAAVVRAVAWRRGRVVVEAERHGETLRIEARRAVVTLPLGVLQAPPGSAGHVRFTPELRGKRAALLEVASGPVVKVTMVFARPFWAEMDGGRYRHASFFFAPNAPFPTFWTSLPLRTPLLVAWCAGPRADALAGKRHDGIVSCLEESLRVAFGRRNYRALLESVAWHDWQGDPFACGAYSYVLAAGGGARRTLARPIEDTLFFAGEACDATGEAATVGGALRSGTRAAREILGRRRTPGGRRRG